MLDPHFQEQIQNAGCFVDTEREREREREREKSKEMKYKAGGDSGCINTCWTNTQEPGVKVP